jgi:2'-5' RNA ligase
MEFYRTFIALPMEVGPEAFQLVTTLKKSLEGERISWVDPARFHLTLRFLGDTPVERVKVIGERLVKEMQAPRFRIKLDTVGNFGSGRRPRVVWIGMESTAPLQGLFNQIERVLIDCGYPPAEQPFRPHLTLGRVRSIKNLLHYQRIMEKFRDRPLGEVEVDRIVFYRSVLESRGPVYTPLYQVRLLDGSE